MTSSNVSTAVILAAIAVIRDNGPVTRLHGICRNIRLVHQREGVGYGRSIVEWVSDRAALWPGAFVDRRGNVDTTYPVEGEQAYNSAGSSMWNNPLRLEFLDFLEGCARQELGGAAAWHRDRAASLQGAVN